MDKSEEAAIRAILIAKLQDVDPEVQQYVFDMLRALENENEEDSEKEEQK